MTDLKSPATLANEALWASKSAVVEAIAKRGVDPRKADTANQYLVAARAVAVYVASADGHLTNAERSTIDHLFWLTPQPVSTLAMRGSPGLLASATHGICAWAWALANDPDRPEQRDPGQNLVYVAIERVLQTVLAADANEQPEVDRLVEFMKRLRTAIVSETCPVAPDAASSVPNYGTHSNPGNASQVSASLNDQSIAADLAVLDRLVGLSEVKRQVETLVNLAKVFALRRQMGIAVPPMSFHLVFMGNPGTGKTTVARIVAQLYGKLGLLSQGQLVEVDRSELVAGYVGQTATKVEEVLASARGGVLFIDEAYALAGGDENDFGQEAVATLIKGMEDNRTDLVVIAAGYTDRMREFLDMNPGLRSRMSRDIRFDDYSPTEMVDIFRGMATAADYLLPEDCDRDLGEAFQQLWDHRDENFANARDVRNLFERVIDAQANRVGVLPSPSVDDVRLITAADLQAAIGNAPAAQ